MNQDYSLNTQKYLRCFQTILDNMIFDMSNAALFCSLSMSFINQMIPHHYAAIQMSKNLLLYTTNIELQNIACNIISTQTESIHNMMDIYNGCCKQNSQEEINCYFDEYDKISSRMFTDMQNAKSNNDINISFMNEMIPHHIGAIQMSKNLLQYPICSELCPILEAIITSQEQGVKQMQALLKKIDSTKY